MKKLLVILLCAATVLSMTACMTKRFNGIPGIESSAAADNHAEDKDAAIKGDDLEAVEEESSEAQEAPSASAMSITDFDSLLSQQPVTVVNTKYIVQDEQYKALYPDMLSATIQNNTNSDIKNATIAFVGWDQNNLPVKIKSSIDFSDGAYVREVNYSDINLVAGASFGDGYGYEIDEECGIASFKAVVVSFETFEGETWENAYYDEWCTLYSGVKYSDSLTVEVTVEENGFEGSVPSAAGSNDTPAEEQTTTAGLTEADLNAQVAAQGLKVTSTNYLVQDPDYKALYPDMLQAIVQNDTASDIKNYVVAFAAWDANNLPVKIKGSIDFSDGAYVYEISFSDANIVPGASYGDMVGFEVDEACGIVTLRAIVVSYEAYDGTTWTNPLYQDWTDLYAGVKLPG